MVFFGIARLHVARDEAEVVDHHRLAPADLAGDAQRQRQRHAALELDLLLRLVELDAVQAGDEIEVPEGAAIFAVGRGAQADFLLLADRGLDAAVLDRPQRLGGQRSCLARGAGLRQLPGAQQAAHMVGPERWQIARPDPTLRCIGHGHWIALLTPPRLSYRLNAPAENSEDAAWTADDRATITRRPPSPGRPTDSPRTMLNRLIVGVAEFSRRHALVVALGGLLLAVFSAFFAMSPSRRHHRHRPDVLRPPAVAAAAPTS